LEGGGPGFVQPAVNVKPLFPIHARLSAQSPNAVMNPVKVLSKFVQGQKWLLFHRKSSRKYCDGRQLVNCLYQAPFGRFADTGGLAHYVHQLQSGVSLEVLAEDLEGVG
jgi:hypothetical protein